jgi:hypothetical protein
MATGNTEIQVVNTVKTYWKIILPIAIVGFIFAVYFIGTCNGKKSTNTTPVDTLNAKIKAVQAANVILEAKNVSLEKLKVQDSIQMVAMAAAMNNIQVIYVHTLDSAKHLSLTAAVNLMKLNLKDATNKIALQISTNLTDTLVSMPYLNVYTINSEYITNSFLSSDNNDLKKEVKIELNKDSLNTAIIANYKTIITGDVTVTESLQEANATLTKSLATETKKYKRQRFFKDVFMGVAGVLLIFSALK